MDTVVITACLEAIILKYKSKMFYCIMRGIPSHPFKIHLANLFDTLHCHVPLPCTIAMYHCHHVKLKYILS